MHDWSMSRARVVAVPNHALAVAADTSKCQPRCREIKMTGDTRARPPYRSLIEQRRAYRGKEFLSRERLGQDPAHAQAARGIPRCAEAAPESRRNEKDRRFIRFLKRSNEAAGASRARDVGNHEPRRTVSRSYRARPRGARLDGHGIARLAEPALHKLADEIVRLDDDDIPGLPHQCPFDETTIGSRLLHGLASPIAIEDHPSHGSASSAGSNVSADMNCHVRYIFGMRVPAIVIGPGSLRR